ncbi:MAG TPA: Cache 3/Cache 2 fusion domain-containing protein [Blastocatellia bacterium]|nr:Cache 3/Cache 2 fusion domain-containing protein [Blastocatellia bacterium]
MKMPPLKLRGKIVGAMVVAASLPAIVLIILTIIQGRHLSSMAGEEIEGQVKPNLARQAKAMYLLCQTQHELLKHVVDTNLNIAHDIVTRRGGAALGGDSVVWQATDQFTQQQVRVSLPRMSIGGTWLGQNTDPQTYTPIVDDVVKLSGGTVTIFQRMNDQGDMLRVATNVVTKEKKRAVGTYIPANNPDGKPNPVVSSVMSGKIYKGRAFVVDQWYITAYEPLKDSSGRLAGMLYVGIPQESLTSVRQAFLDSKFGQSGYVFVIGGSGDSKGKYIISKDGARDGENIWNTKSDDGQYPIQIMVNGAIKANGQIFFHSYPWKNNGETSARTKQAATIYFEPWDWVIGVSAYEDEFLAGKRRVDGAMNFLLWTALIGGLIAIGIAVLLGSKTGMRIAGEAKHLALAADKLAQGDVDLVVKAHGSDEMGDLSRSMIAMVENVQSGADVARKIAVGDLSAEIKAKSDKDILAQSLSQVVTILRELVEEGVKLGQAAVAGRLDERARADQFNGGYRELVEGFNQTLDAVIKPINEASDVLSRVAERDLTKRITGNYQGDYAKVKESLNQAVQNLEDTLTQMASGAEQVSSAAEQVSSGSQALAQGASEQAGSIEEISSSLQEMASMSKQSTENAREAVALADRARESAERGSENMRKLSEAIGKIRGSALSTAKIVKTIDEIAFQTNLLALNAAVEAARAGDAGKGFAVVAEEVRRLAMRSAEAAKNTTNLIEESVKNAEGGVILDEAVLRDFEEINHYSSKVSDVMAEIAAASDQQSVGVTQITAAIGEVGKVTQQAAANAEESASASEEMSAQSEEMLSLVSSFKLNNAARAVTPHTSKLAGPGWSLQGQFQTTNGKDLFVPCANGDHREVGHW